MAGDRIVLRPHLNTSDVLDPHDAAIWRSPDHDLFELLRRSQSALRPDRVREFLALARGLAVDLPRWIDRVLRLIRRHYLCHGHGELYQLIAIYSQVHR